jgi:GNAT superfamily N-acetyltransferase
MKLELDDHPEIDDLRLLIDGVRGFNRNITGHERTRPVAVFLRDEHGRIVGGVQGDLWGRSMHIAVLWVYEKYRGQGHGSKLMKAIEDFAVAHGHPLVYVETTSFQARPFYEGLGYRVFGELPGISEGHTMYFLKKELKAN